MILTLTAASGVGKGALMRALREALPHRARLLTSATTRKQSDRDLQMGVDSEYDYLSEEAFDAEAQRGAFLKVFGDYGNRYGTRVTRFDWALAKSDEVFMAALFIPAVELFWEEARKREAYADRVRSVYLDLSDEKERHRRLRARGDIEESAPERFKPQLEEWREEAKNSFVPFFFLQATEPPEVLAAKVREQFSL